jgi:hypothetical protein
MRRNACCIRHTSLSVLTFDPNDAICFCRDAGLLSSATLSIEVVSLSKLLFLFSLQQSDVQIKYG